MLGRSLLSVGFAVAVWAGGTAPLSAQMSETAALAPAIAPDHWLTTLLRKEDAAHYRKILVLQRDGHWAEADKQIALLEDPLLMGHVKAQRYLHPTAYRSRYSELKAWLDTYADHPQAEKIHTLALRRKPKGSASPRKPTGEILKGYAHTDRILGGPRAERLSSSQRALERKITKALRRGYTLVVKRYLQDRKTRSTLPIITVDRLKASLAMGYFGDNRDEWAYQWAVESTRSASLLPQTHWVAGLAAWRLQKYPEALAHFAQVAEHEHASSWLKAGGAFWAARAALWTHKPEDVNRWLKKASAYPRTFYGLLAIRVLALYPQLDLSKPDLHRGVVDQIARTKNGRRALALIQVGEPNMAQQELDFLARDSDGAMRQGILAVAAETGMANLAAKLSAREARRGVKRSDVLAYPIPNWQPIGGYVYDKALIFAIARQESAFRADAESWAGARGVMQLMPATARFVAKNSQLGSGAARRLDEPRVNVHLGQRYLDYLLNDRKVGDNLFYVLGSWNAGPGNVHKWQETLRSSHDPLMFIESIPLAETRDFIERVMANLWIYRLRMGQPAPSLDALAAGKWPAYVAMDGRKL
ncbi:MAG: lytic transglycosylase domain-containing protein [Magnetospiraceae bacterium]